MSPYVQKLTLPDCSLLFLIQDFSVLRLHAEFRPSLFWTFICTACPGILEFCHVCFRTCWLSTIPELFHPGKPTSPVFLLHDKLTSLLSWTTLPCPAPRKSLQPGIDLPCWHAASIEESPPARCSFIKTDLCCTELLVRTATIQQCKGGRNIISFAGLRLVYTGCKVPPSVAPQQFAAALWFTLDSEQLCNGPQVLPLRCYSLASVFLTTKTPPSYQRCVHSPPLPGTSVLVFHLSLTPIQDTDNFTHM